MAPVGEVYFPPLDRCLSGEHQLLSWQATYVALSQLDAESDDRVLKKFSGDPQTAALLAHSFSPYSAPTPQTKSTFETKTSSINVTPSSHARYNIQQIKDDSLWLSHETKIDEVSALRIAVLEWQTRPATQLLNGDLGDEASAPFASRIVRGELHSSIFDPGSSLLARPRVPEADSRSDKAVGVRRRRLLEIYLSERRFVIKVSEYLTSGAMCQKSPIPTENAGHGKLRSNWLEDIGHSILSTWELGIGERANGMSFIVGAVGAVRSRLRALERGSGWDQEEEMQEEVDIAWARTQILELIHIMQILVNLLQSTSQMMTSSEVLAWYKLMNEVAFFEGFQPPFTALRDAYDLPLRSLVALVSLAILNIPSSMALLSHTAASGATTAPSIKDSPYLLHSATVKEINDILVGAASIRVLSPAGLAWAVLTQVLRDSALAVKESREVRQSLRAADKYNAADSSDTDGAERASSSRIDMLQRRSSTGSDSSQHLSLLEEIHETIGEARVDGDSLVLLANSAIELVIVIAEDFCDIFGFEHAGRPGQKMRSLFLDLIQVCISYNFVDYSASLLSATLAVLEGSGRFSDFLEGATRPDKDDPSARFLKNRDLQQRLFLTAKAHFPYDTLTFVRLCRALTINDSGRGGPEPPMWKILEELDTFACKLPASFTGYELIRTDEERDYIQLTEDLNFTVGSHDENSLMLGSTPSKLSRASLGRTFFRGTQGQLLNSAKPGIVAWKHDYSCLSYIGEVLQYASVTPDLSNPMTNSIISSEVATEMIKLMTALLSAATRSSPHSTLADATDLAHEILESASDGLDRNQDAVSVVLEIFERELFECRKSSGDLQALDLLVECIHFICALLPVIPDRVWPFLGRSALLGVGRDESQLKIVVASYEIVTGRYGFLLGSIRLFDALIEECVAHAVSRKTPTKTVARFGNAQPQGAGVSETTMAKVLLNFTRLMIEVYESTMNWRFVRKEERMEMNSRLCSIFQKILEYSFGTDDNPNLSTKLTNALAPSAEYIVETFLSRSSSEVTILPLMHILAEGVITPVTSLPTRDSHYWASEVRAVLRLVKILVETNKLLRNSTSHLEESLFKATPLLVRLYVAHESYKRPVVEAFDALVRTAAADGRQPPSLLGHLGESSAVRLLEVLSILDRPLKNSLLLTAIWRLFSSIVSKRQRWFAILVLSGSTPRETFKEKADNAGSEPILNIALDALSNISRLEPGSALSMLEFVSLAADFWPWALTIMEKHSHFLKAISEYATHIGSLAATSRENALTISADFRSIQMTSHIADILSMYTRYTQQAGNQKFAKMLVPHLNYLINNAISAPSYNASLHINLRQNFESRFTGCSLSDFKRTVLTRSKLGDSFYYDLELADKMLAYDSAWIGKKGHGFAEEVRRANLNLSVVESQINLFHSWKALLVEFSGSLASEPKFQQIMAIAITDCLKANAENTLPEAVIERLAQSRADLAFTLLQRLLEVKSTEVEVKNILPEAWNTLRKKNHDVGAALESDDADYYRILLRILYLSLEVHVSANATATKPSAANNNPSLAQRWSSTPEMITRTMLEILALVVAQGFRSLTTLLHDNQNRVQPSDFSLLTAILRTLVHIPDITHNTTHILTAFSNAQTARYASTLLSWSDQLAMSGDPIYGELSIFFLLEMSSVPALAESLAVEGVLTHILSTNLVCFFGSRPFGPFEQPVRMYRIWACGLLPLLLNLLTAVGAGLAAEIAAALNNYPHQLAQATNAFGMKGHDDPNAEHITLTMATEAHSLALITRILQTFRDAGASASVVSSQIEEISWDKAQVKEDAEGWLQRRGALRDRVVPTNEREETWSRAKPRRTEGDADNRLEEKLVDEMKAIVEILSSGNGEN